MNNYNVKKRQIMSFDDFAKNAQKNVEKLEKGEHEMVTKSTDKLVNDKKGVETLDEAYNMNVDEGDMAEEHAKAVIVEAIEKSAETGTIDMKAAFDKVAQDNSIPEGTEGIIVSAMKGLLKSMASAANDPMLGK